MGQARLPVRKIREVLRLKADGARGIATSIKSLDIGAASYRNVAILTRTLNGYVDDLGAFAGRTWAGVTVPGASIAGRELVLAIPSTTMTAAQHAAIQSVALYELPGIPNPFSDVTVSWLMEPENLTWWVRLAVELSRSRGINAVLPLLPENRRGTLIDVLKENSTGWWDPDQIWAVFSSQVSSLINPFSQNGDLSAVELQPAGRVYA